MQTPEGIKIEYVSIGKLKPAKYNPRKITEEELEKLKTNIKEFGMVDPIVVNSDLTIIGGHQRFKACLDLGFREMPVVKVDLNKKQEKILNISLNKIKGEWDERKLAEAISQIKHKYGLAGFSKHEVKKLLNKYSMDTRFLEGEEEPFDAEEEVARITEPRTKPGDLYRLSRHRLLCGDATRKEDVERLMKGKKADMVFTDPPYNYGHMYGGGIFKEEINKVAREIDAICIFNPDGFLRTLSLYFNGNMNAFVFCNKDLVPNYLNHALNAGYNFNILTWHKKTFIPLGGKHHYPDTEYCIFISKNPVFNSGLSADHYYKYWVEEKDEIQSKVHPTAKPVKIIILQIELCSKSKGIVGDPFLGSGTTLIACERTGRICYGMEIDPVYCDVIVARWEKYTGKKAKLL